jgi:uridine phosphorylase
MSPFFQNKHSLEALFNPADFVTYANYPTDLPAKYVLTYETSALNYFRRRYRPAQKIKLRADLSIYQYRDTGFVRIAGIGSPNAVTAIEELIALGGKTFITVGTAGGLYREGIFLCKRALRDEGTSYHYTSRGKYSYPDKELTSKLGRCLRNQGLKYFEGTTWTTDAPYRETRAEIKHYAKKGVATVEMEASALFVVAKYRKAKIAGAFIVGDVLEERWEPKFKNIAVKSMLNRLVDTAMECLE